MIVRRPEATHWPGWVETMAQASVTVRLTAGSGRLVLLDVYVNGGSLKATTAGCCCCCWCWWHWMKMNYHTWSFYCQVAKLATIAVLRSTLDRPLHTYNAIAVTCYTVFTALHGMQTRTSHEKFVRRPSATKVAGIDVSIRTKIWVGDFPFYAKIRQYWPTTFQTLIFAQP